MGRTISKCIIYLDLRRNLKTTGDQQRQKTTETKWNNSIQRELADQNSKNMIPIYKITQQPPPDPAEVSLFDIVDLAAASNNSTTFSPVFAEHST